MKLLIILPLLAAGLLPQVAYAEEPITAKAAVAENKFPEEVIVTAEAQSTAGDIRAMTLKYMVGSGLVERYGTLEFTPGRSVQGRHAIKTGGNNFVAPGADITYWLEVQDAAGNKIETVKETFWYADTRFQWRNVKEGSVTVYYYRNAEQTARELLVAAQQTEAKVGKMLGTAGRPFRVMLYNTAAEITGAQRPETSVTRQQQILRVGVAYSGEDLVQVLGTGSLGAQDTARHEIAHLYVHWTAGSNVPASLNEGLAVWSQNDPGREYLGSLERAIARDELLLVRGMDSFPGRPDETILAYGQSYSLVKYLIDSYGGDKLRQVFESMRQGNSAADAIQKLYGLKMDELDAAWRKYVGAKPRTYDQSVPTPVTIGNFTPIDAPVTGQTGTATPAPAAGLPPFMMALVAVLGGLLLLVGGAAVFTMVRRRG